MLDVSGDSDLQAAARAIAGRLSDLAAIGKDSRGGWSRIGFTETEREAHGLFKRWADDLGLDYHQDCMGNSHARLGVGSSRLVVGSHLDTVPTGGNFDGAAGVVAALEAVAQLRHAELRHQVDVVVFSCEEGARFAQPCIGSRTIVGALKPESLPELLDSNGVSAFDAARAVGLHPENARDEIWKPAEVACYLELHIEQGRVLEESNIRLGIVDAIAGATRLEVTLRGRADHSGTTPMTMRHDALTGAAEVIVFVEEAAGRRRSAVATVGRIKVSPNVITTVPGEVVFTVDVRDIDPMRQRALAGEVVQQVQRVCARRGLRGSARLLHDQSPFLMHYWLRQELVSAAEDGGISYRVLPSGAGHDAGYVSSIAPAGMLFVPSREGISHSPAEWSEVEDIAQGALVLARALARIDSATWMQ